jgi:hypothetical protein
MRYLTLVAIIFAAAVPVCAANMPARAEQQSTPTTPGITPQEVLPDALDSVDMNGTTVRKGSVGAFVANARLLHDATSSPAAREGARAQIVALVPALEALGIFDFFIIRDPELAAIVQGTKAKQ